jgi:hypothetical protein
MKTLILLFLLFFSTVLEAQHSMIINSIEINKLPQTNYNQSLDLWVNKVLDGHLIGIMQRQDISGGYFIMYKLQYDKCQFIVIHYQQPDYWRFIYLYNNAAHDLDGERVAERVSKATQERIVKIILKNQKDGTIETR